jgi:murein endopeptidase
VTIVTKCNADEINAYTRARVHKRVDEFLDRVLEREPRWDHSEHFALRLAAAITANDCDDRPILQVSATSEESEDV